MSGKKSAGSNHSVRFVNSHRKSSTASEELIEGDRDSYVKSTLQKSSVDQLVESSSKRITLCTMCGRYKGYRVRRKLFIILCIATALLVCLLGIIIVLYAIVPAIVRSTINIEEIGNDRFRLRAQLELSRTGSIPATILSPLIINVDNVGTVRNDQPIVIAGDADHSTIVPINSLFIVSNLEAFHSFSRSLIFESHVVWQLTAKASVQPISSAMPVYSNIPFNKKVTLNALNSLRNVEIKSISLRRSNAERIFADIIIEISNPSIFSIDLGKDNLGKLFLLS